MIRTCITDEFDLSYPIMSAGLAFAARPPLAAAVSNAGGMGFLGADLVPAWTVVEMIQTTRRLTTRPFGVAFAGAYVTDAQIRACVAVPPAAVAFHGALPTRTWLDELRDCDIEVWLQVASPAEARVAVRNGATAIIAQGDESEGYRSSANLLTLLPAVAQAAAPLPVIASGGIADGRRLAAVLMLGADAAWCGTRFLASEEASLCHQRFRPSAGDATSASIGPRQRFRNRSSELAASDVAVSPRARAKDVRQTLLGDSTGTDASRCVDATGSGDLATILPTWDVVDTTGPAPWPTREQAKDLWGIKSAAEILQEMSDEADVVLEVLLSTIARGVPTSSR